MVNIGVDFIILKYEREQTIPNSKLLKFSIVIVKSIKY